MSFNDFGFKPEILKAITERGYETPTPIQQQAIPAVLSGRDVLGLAQTGTGKTAAFVLPILQRLSGGPRRKTRVLILSPTRELAAQTQDSIVALGAHTGFKSAVIFGGVNINPQMAALKRGPEIVVACPGRLLDHIGRGTVDLSGIEMLVLDEADRMCDMGFLPDIRRIIAKLPRQRQTLLFSATMPEEIRKLTIDFQHEPQTVQIGLVKPAATVSHVLYPVEKERKTALLRELLKSTATDSVIIFTRTKHGAKRLSQQLTQAGYATTCLQGNLSQNRREEAIAGFRSGAYQILVATDIAARGIDVAAISHVFNFDMPDTVDAYPHRIGRTGRAERSGAAITFATGEDVDVLRMIEKALGTPIERRQFAGFEYELPLKAVPKPKSEQRGQFASRRPGASRPGGAVAPRTGARPSRESAAGHGRRSANS